MNADLALEDMQRRRIIYQLIPEPIRPLPRYTDWLRGTHRELWCEVMSIQPELNMKWRYKEQQEEIMQPWRCAAVWLHAAWLPEWRVLQGTEVEIFNELEDAINTLVGNPESTRYTLLVNPNGLFYDTNRLGGDHHVTAASGRRFCFSVRRGIRDDDKILLAIAF